MFFRVARACVLSWVEICRELADTVLGTYDVHVPVGSRRTRGLYVRRFHKVGVPIGNIILYMIGKRVFHQPVVLPRPAPRGLLGTL